MPAIVTRNFRNAQVESFLDKTQDASTEVYLFMGNPFPWEDEESPPLPVDNDNSIFAIWDNIYAIQKIASNKISQVVRRRNWKLGTIFDYYNTTMLTNIAETNFYCVTSNFQVYKCIWNNNGAASTVEPVGVGTGNIVETSDGYKWAYMYEITTQAAQTFFTPEYMPIINDGTVASAAADNAGEVTAVKVDSASAGYLSVEFSGTSTRRAEGYANVSGGVISEVVITDGGAGYEVGPTISITYGGGNGATFNTPATIVNGSITDPTMAATTGGTNYVKPAIVIEEGSGSDFAGEIIASQGVVRSISITNPGSNYRYLRLSSTGGTSAPTLTPILTPPAGHGADAIGELGGTNIMFSAAVNQDIFPAGNKYRQIGIVYDPFDGGTPFTGLVASNMIELTLGTVTGGAFAQNEIVTDGTSGAKGKVIFWDSTASKLFLIQTINENYLSFADGNTVSGANASAVINTTTAPTLNKYSGEIQYIENRSPITRAPNQIEDVRVVIEF